MDQAPDIKKNFPSGGERLGPGWNQLWAGLGKQSGRRFVAVTEIAAYYGPKTGLAETTIGNLLRQAANAGLIERKYIQDGSVKRVYYRRPAA